MHKQLNFTYEPETRRRRYPPELRELVLLKARQGEDIELLSVVHKVPVPVVRRWVREEVGGRAEGLTTNLGQVLAVRLGRAERELAAVRTAISKYFV